MTTLTHNTAIAGNVAIPRPKQQQVVTCVTGGYRFAIPANHLAGVYQISREQISARLDIVDTPEGKLPVASLADLLSAHLQINLQPSDDERALIGIRAAGHTVTIRAGSVSRPINVKTNHWHRLPRIAHPTDRNDVISSVVNIGDSQIDPNQALALVVNPFRALDIEDAGSDTEQQTSELNRSIDGAIPQRRGSGQLLAFVPEDVSKQQLNYVFCLPLAAVAEVVNAQETLITPLNSNIFGGYILWRKLPVPIINLGASFGLAQVGSDNRTHRRGRRLVIARASQHRYVAFYTQSQMHSMKTPQAFPTTFDNLENRPYLGAFKTDFGDMVIPDLDRILDFK